MTPVSNYASSIQLSRKASETTLEATLSRIVKSGIQIKVCVNSLDRLGYDPDNLAEGIEPVPSGVAEAVQLQQKNDVYLKLP